MGCVRFGIPREQVIWLKDHFHLHSFVETGTNQAETSLWASNHFDRVVTIEAHEPLYRSAVERHSHVGNIEFVLGDSRDCLKSLLPTLTVPALFWLDAHWCGSETHGRSHECPVIDELRMINESSVDHFILIDDARLFLAPPPAPHNADHWPSIREICDLLGRC